MKKRKKVQDSLVSTFFFFWFIVIGLAGVSVLVMFKICSYFYLSDVILRAYLICWNSKKNGRRRRVPTVNRQRRCQGEGQQRRLFSFPQDILISGAIADPERHLHICKVDATLKERSCIVLRK